MAEWALLLHEEDGGTQRFPVGEAALLVGRSSDADIRLEGDMVSRRHALVKLKDGVLTIEDLDSRNGFTVNEEPTREATLANSDRVAIGSFTLTVELSGIVPPDSSFIQAGRAAQVCETILLESGSHRLSVLYKTAELLGAVADPDDLLNQLLRVIFDALPAEHAYVLTLEPDALQPEVRATHPRDNGGSKPPLSMTLVEHVIAQEESVLTKDALNDTRFREAASVVAMSIHSVMCVPLRGRSGIEGAVYIDSCAKHDAFSDADLELLTAIGCVAGVAVENARLYQENLERERLAAIGQATAGIGHCVKNILTGIKGGARFIDMAREKEDLKHLDRGWPLMSRAIERMETLVLNMLAFSRDQEPDRKPCDLNQIVSDVLNVVRTRAEKYDITLEFQAGELESLEVDETGLFRVILNLVTNAIDACEREGGTVTVKTHADAVRCCIEVCDTGPGVKPEFHSHLFEAFASTKGSSGTGLGLVCSRKIVREHGGDLTFVSEKGKGATFVVSLDKPGSTEQ